MIPTYIVDDVASDRYIARRRLTKAGGFDPIVEATDGVEFLDVFFSPTRARPSPDTSPELILLDINMPELDGFETLAELKRRRSPEGAARQIVALFSSSDNERDKVRSRDSGIVEFFFTKPISDTAIEAILETYRTRGHL